MHIPEKYLPKLKCKRVSIPEIKIQSKHELKSQIENNKPFIFNINLTEYLSIVQNEINAIDNEYLIKTFDSIPYSEIREGLFTDYFKYVNESKSDKNYPDNFKLVESRKGWNYQNELRHYALSLNQKVFPAISNFKIPFLEDDNYLSQLNQSLFDEFNVTSPHWLFIHPSFSVSNAHFDHDNVHTVIFQLKGSKRAFLVSPFQHKNIQNSNYPTLPNGFNDFLNEQIENLPTEDLILWEGNLNENQILFIPKKWVHFVVGGTSGISYSQDIVLKDNFNEWLNSIMLVR